MECLLSLQRCGKPEIHFLRKGIGKSTNPWKFSNIFIEKEKKKSQCTKKKTQWILNSINIIRSINIQITWGRGRSHLSYLNSWTPSCYFHARRWRHVPLPDLDDCTYITMVQSNYVKGKTTSELSHLFPTWSPGWVSQEGCY